jgi:hypothetical protein
MKIETASIQPELLIFDLLSPVIQIGIFESDCIDIYRKELMQRFIESNKGINKFFNSSTFEMKYLVIRLAWDSVFRLISAYDCYAVIPKESKPEATLLNDRELEFVKMNYPVLIPYDYKQDRYLLSKCLNYKKHIYCWNIKIEISKSNNQKIQLVKENLYDLEKDYDEVFAK